MSFGDVLQRLRLDAGLSQSELAVKANVPFQTIQNWEQGRREPRAQVLMALAAALGVSVEKLLAEGFAEDKQPVKPAPKKPATKKGKK